MMGRLMKKIIFPIILSLWVMACEQDSAPPEKVDLVMAAKLWNTEQTLWNETELYTLEKGKRLYKELCSPCHLSSGEGQQQTIGAPALKGSFIAKSSAEALITTVLNGRNSMPSFRKSVNDVSLAAILSYVRNAWGNDSAEIIMPAEVEALRASSGSNE